MTVYRNAVMFLPDNEEAAQAQALFADLDEAEPILRRYDQFRGQMSQAAAAALRTISQPDPLHH